MFGSGFLDHTNDNTPNVEIEDMTAHLAKPTVAVENAGLKIGIVAYIT
jgi:hypothetical protein